MKRSFSFLLMIYSSLTIFAQDAHFSQYNNSRIYTNPAFTGTDSTLVLSANYRMQWPKSEPYQSFNFSADKYFHSLRGGLGINFLHDDQMNGVFTTSRIDINYAPHFELFHHKLVVQPGIQFSFFQNTVDFSKLTFGDQIDPRRGFVYSSNDVSGPSTKSNIDLSAGLLLYSDHFFGGFAIHHINQPDEGIIGSSMLPYKITVQAGANLSLKNDSTHKFIFSPTILFMQQQDFTMFLPGITVKYKFISLGLSYRSEAFITTLAFQNRFLRVGYSYDYTTSSLLNKNTGGSHEIGLTWFINFKKKHCNIKTLRLI
ncbi:MAG: PorP/SprF family type IX secretion system membrane protein [Bacteroidia bacterium]